jgi:hypothetical protein
MKTEKIIFGLQQCYNMSNDERVNYPDHQIDWGYDTAEEAYITVVKRLENKSKIYFKMYSKTVTIEFMGNFEKGFVYNGIDK